MSKAKTWGERRTRSLARKRARKLEQARRDAGNSVLRIKSGRQRMPDRDPAELNGPVIVKVPGKPPERLPTLAETRDNVRYAPSHIRKQVLMRDEYKCRYCGFEVTDKTANIDHVVPWKRGGKTTMRNLVSCCRDCNKRKGNAIWQPKAIVRYRKNRIPRGAKRNGYGEGILGPTN